MECTYYYCNDRKKYFKHECLKKTKKVSKKCYYKHCSNINYDVCPIYEEEQAKNCIFTTILCRNANLPKDNYILKNIYNFRKNILEQDEQYKELLIIHDRISPIISNTIRHTYNSEFLEFIYLNFLIPINKNITINEVERAITIYKRMLELLIVNYDLSQEYAAIKHHYKNPKPNKIKIRIKNYF